MNENAEPASHHVARAARLIANVVRRYRGYALINGAKRLGLRSAVFGRTRPVEVPAADRDWLREQLQTEFDLYRSWLAAPADGRHVLMAAALLA
jgi:hypothetical protein